MCRTYLDPDMNKSTVKKIMGKSETFEHNQIFRWKKKYYRWYNNGIVDTTGSSLSLRDKQ